MATATRGRGLELPRLHRALRLGKPLAVVVIIAVLVVAYPLLKNDAPWPQGLIYALNVRLDEVYNWIVNNQGTSWIYVYFLNQISSFLNWLVTELANLLNGLTWIGVPLALCGICLRWCGWRASLVVLAALASFGFMGLWAESMDTLALMIAAVSVSLAIGIPLGVWAGRSDGFNRAITPVLDAMQIIPAFAYLMPVVILFSIGNPSAVIVTVIYAVPPAVRITALGIRGVAANAVEAADSMGATRMQVLGKVQLPLARRTIMLGVNQTIMMALSMVVIASLIGGAGLGDVIVSSLTTLDVGSATIGGAAIVFLAIALDRATSAAGARADLAVHHDSAEARRQRRLVTGAGLVVIVVASLIARAVGAGAFPEPLSARGDLVGWINSAVTWAESPSHPIYPATSNFGNFLVNWGLEPLRSFMVGTPWYLMIAGAMLIALTVAGRRQAIEVGLFLAAIGVMGVWTDAMDTASQVIVATGLTLLLGFLVGVWASESPRVERVLRPILDALQTLPQFVYLVPVVALFNVGRVPGIIASVLYAMPVVIRLVTAGLRDVSATAVEAASSFGASRLQLLLKVKIPLARPAIMLGINQGIVMVLAVVIVAGLVGGGALGYEVVVGLNRDAFGDGVVASLAILSLGIVLDRITQTGARVSGADRS
ncbi:MAG: ABC transporter permease subunit [Gaiellales bacterium]